MGSFYKNTGYMVEVVADGRTGRTKHSDKPINGKVPVYLESAPMSLQFSTTGTLFSPDQIKVIGFID